MDYPNRPGVKGHSAAAAMIAVNPNPLLICKQLGHSSIRTTFDRYGHLFPDQSAQLIAALDDQWSTTIAQVGSTT